MLGSHVPPAYEQRHGQLYTKLSSIWFGSTPPRAAVSSRAWSIRIVSPLNTSLLRFIRGRMRQEGRIGLFEAGVSGQLATTNSVTSSPHQNNARPTSTTLALVVTAR
jgi:hypothetical protein